MKTNKFVAFVMAIVIIILLCSPASELTSYAEEANWIKKYYTDIFGDKTEEYYLVNAIPFSGSYNNETGSDLPLSADMVIDINNISILLSSEEKKIKNSSGNDVLYSLIVKHSGDVQQEMTGTMSENSDRIVLDGEYYTEMIDLLSIINNDISVYIEETNHRINNYRFKANSCDFGAVYGREITDVEKNLHYINAEKYLEEKDFLNAINEFSIAADYKDSEGKLETLVDLLGGAEKVQAGYHYTKGESQRYEYPDAAECLQLACDQGDSNAMYYLGIMYRKGQGVKKSTTKAAELFQASSEHGNSGAKVQLGQLYTSGQGVKRDYSMAVNLFLEAIKNGNSDAMYNLGVLYQKGQGVDKNSSEAIEWFERAADLGNTEAMCKLGEIYRDGKVVDKDITAAIEWYEKAADLNNTDAMLFLGNHYFGMFDFNNEVEKDYSKAFEYYEKAANLGNRDAMWMLALAFINAEGQFQNRDKGNEWGTRAARLGHRDAAFSFGTGLADGTYDGISYNGYWGPVSVTVTITKGQIASISCNDTEKYEAAEKALEELKRQALIYNGEAIDAISGATVTTDAFKEALSNALEKAYKY